MLFTQACSLGAAIFTTLFTSTLSAPAPSSYGSGYWLGQPTFHRNAPVVGINNSAYKVFRNVRDYGAAGDGTTDDTAAIQKAMNDGARCLQGCNSSTLTPAMVYFPAGTYIISKPIQMPYYTQVVGDATNLPILQAAPTFVGMAILDSDPYSDTGASYFVNQNNFFRQVRNFVFDLTKISAANGAAIHWQVAQATSLQNLVFNMIPGSKQLGIFMDNGSGGWMSDLVFNGGNIGAFLGNQQFTSRNMTFNNCATAIVMNWNWGWLMDGITVNGGTVGLDISTSPTNATVGSVVLADSTFKGVTYGIRTAYKLTGNVPNSGNTLVVNNVDMSQVTTGAIVAADNTIILPPSKIAQWAQGNGYNQSSTQEAVQGNGYNQSTTQKAVQGAITVPIKDASLLDNNGNIFGRSKPQYEHLPASSFLSAMASGCKGNGVSDDTAAIQSFLNQAASSGQVAYFDHGNYIITSTINVPSNIRIVGEVWSNLVAKGFTDANNPTPVWHVGSSVAGTSGSVEMSDLLFGIQGPNPGAIMIQWDLDSQQGQSGMWDVHVNMGGSVTSQLDLANCAANPSQTKADPACDAGFLMFYAGPGATNVYLENTWLWLADHSTEDPLNRQISLYQGRGVLIQSKTTWLWGTASEHSQLYNYQFDGANALFAGFIQSETPYMQGDNFQAPSSNSSFNDPTFSMCDGNSSAVPCRNAWGLRVVNSQAVLIYSAGLYSFFNNYGQSCVAGQNCQMNMVQIRNSQVSAFALSTKGAVNMIYDDSFPHAPVTDAANRNTFCATVAFYHADSGTQGGTVGGSPYQCT